MKYSSATEIPGETKNNDEIMVPASLTVLVYVISWHWPDSPWIINVEYTLPMRNKRNWEISQLSRYRSQYVYSVW